VRWAELHESLVAFCAHELSAGWAFASKKKAACAAAFRFQRSISSYFTVSLAVVLCVSVPEVPVNVIVNVPLEAPLGTAKSTVT